MENRYEQAQEEAQGWGAYATPPAIPIGQETGESAATGILCADVRERLAELADDESGLDPALASALHGHLSVCSACAAIFAQLKRVISMVESLPPVEFTKNFFGRDHAADPKRRSECVLGGGANPFRIASGAHWDNSVAHPVDTSAQQSETPPILDRGVVNVSEGRFDKPFAFERLVGAVAFAAVLVWVTLNATGNVLFIGATTGCAAWLDSVASVLRGVPLLAWLFGSLLNALSSMADDLGSAYRNLGPAAQEGLAIDIALGFAGIWWARRRRISRLAAR